MVKLVLPGLVLSIAPYSAAMPMPPTEDELREGLPVSVIADVDVTIHHTYITRPLDISEFEEEFGLIEDVIPIGVLDADEIMQLQQLGGGEELGFAATLMGPPDGVAPDSTTAKLILAFEPFSDGSIALGLPAVIDITGETTSGDEFAIRGRFVRIEGTITVNDGLDVAEISESGTVQGL